MMMLGECCLKSVRKLPSEFSPQFCSQISNGTINDEQVVFVTVIAIGKRDRNQIYQAAQSRL